jgi:hypothetical protein
MDYTLLRITQQIKFFTLIHLSRRLGFLKLSFNTRPAPIASVTSTQIL